MKRYFSLVILSLFLAAWTYCPDPGDHVWPLSGSDTPDFMFKDLSQSTDQVTQALDSRHRMSSTFGPRRWQSQGGKYDWHRGIDIPAPCGTPVRAVARGIVRLDGTEGIYSDRAVQLCHSWDGTKDKDIKKACLTNPGETDKSKWEFYKTSEAAYYSNYMHLSDATVSKRDLVDQGAVIGTTGETGIVQETSCDPDKGFDHLHLEFRDQGVYQRHAKHPLLFLPYADTGPPEVAVTGLYTVGDKIIVTADVSTSPQELDVETLVIHVSQGPHGAMVTRQVLLDLNAWNRSFTPRVQNEKSQIYILDTCPEWDGVYDKDYRLCDPEDYLSHLEQHPDCTAIPTESEIKAKCKSGYDASAIMPAAVFVRPGKFSYPDKTPKYVLRVGMIRPAADFDLSQDLTITATTWDVRKNKSSAVRAWSGEKGEFADVPLRRAAWTDGFEDWENVGHLDQMAAMGINQVLLSVNDEKLVGAGLDKAYADKVAEFIELAHEKAPRIQVHAMTLEDPTFTFLSSLGDAVERITRILTFNDEHVGTEFDGIHLDIEPQALENWEIKAKETVPLTGGAGGSQVFTVTLTEGLVIDSNADQNFVDEISLEGAEGAKVIAVDPGLVDPPEPAEITVELNEPLDPEETLKLEVSWQLETDVDKHARQEKIIQDFSQVLSKLRAIVPEALEFSAAITWWFSKKDHLPLAKPEELFNHLDMIAVMVFFDEQQPDICKSLTKLTERSSDFVLKGKTIVGLNAHEFEAFDYTEVTGLEQEITAHFKGPTGSPGLPGCTAPTGSVGQSGHYFGTAVFDFEELASKFSGP